MYNSNYTTGVFQSAVAVAVTVSVCSCSLHLLRPDTIINKSEEIPGQTLRVPGG
jgi:hypothetical protein